jgi:transposase-like protein
MPLSAQLRYVALTLECKHCGHALMKNGGWFMAAPRFKCAGCQREVRITYDDKVALFAKHAHLV